MQAEVFKFFLLSKLFSSKANFNNNSTNRLIFGIIAVLVILFILVVIKFNFTNYVNKEKINLEDNGMESLKE